MTKKTVIPLTVYVIVLIGGGGGNLLTCSSSSGTKHTEILKNGL